MDFKDPTVQKVAVGLLLGIIIGVAFYFLMYSPNAEVIAEKEQTLESKKLKLDEINNKVRNLKQLQAEVDSLFTKYKLLETLMPTERDVPDFLNKLYITAANNGILVKSVKPAKTLEHEFFYADPYELDIETNYHNLGFVLSEIANFPFLTIASNIEIMQSKGSKSNTKPINITLTTYHMPEEARLRNVEQSMGNKKKAPSSKKSSTTKK